MASRARNEGLVYCRASRRWILSKLLNEPLPLESHLHYPFDFLPSINSAVAWGRVTSMIDVLRVLQSFYFPFHLRTHLHFYGVPAAEDVDLFASDFANRVVYSLRDLGCIRLHYVREDMPLRSNVI